MRFHRLHTAAVACFALLVSVATASAQRPRRVGIVVTVQVNLTVEEARTIAVALGEAIRREFDVEVITGEETERRLPLGGIPDECVAQADCRNDLGRRLDADELLMLVVIRLGDQVQIDSTWAHVASGDSASRPRVTIPSSDDQGGAMAGAAPRLLPHIKKPEGRPPPPEIILLPQTADTPPQRAIPIATWIAGGVGVAALVGGGVFALSARQSFESLDADGCRTMACSTKRLDDLESDALVADVLFGAAGVALISAVVLYYATGARDTNNADDTPVKDRPGVRLQTGPKSVGVAVGGEF